MPRYFFDIQASGSSLPDDLGIEFAEREQARQEAMRALSSIALELAAHKGDAQAYSVIVRDETRAPVFAISMCIVCQEL